MLFYSTYVCIFPNNNKAFKLSNLQQATMSAATMSAPKNYHAGNTRYNQNQGARKATAYCKVCHDAGRPKSEYTSHFVKDKKGPGGKVVCPLLLNQECRYCHEKGHTPKECPEIKAKEEKRREYEQRKREARFQPDQDGFRCARNISHRPQKSRVPVDAGLSARLQRANLFSALRPSSSDEEEEEVPVKSDFPLLVKSTAVTSTPQLTGWAAMAAKPAAPKPKPVEVQQPTTTRCAWDDSESDCDSQDVEAEAVWKQDYEKYKGMSWADMMDEESDEEDW